MYINCVTAVNATLAAQWTNGTYPFAMIRIALSHLDWSKCNAGRCPTHGMMTMLPSYAGHAAPHSLQNTNVKLKLNFTNFFNLLQNVLKWPPVVFGDFSSASD